MANYNHAIVKDGVIIYKDTKRGVSRAFTTLVKGDALLKNKWLLGYTSKKVGEKY